MPDYALDRLAQQEFERLVQALLKTIIRPGTTTFGAGPDGGREATFTGRAHYPSTSEQWNGAWIFQAKFHDTRQLGPDGSREQLLRDLPLELDKITVKYKRDCQNYILATNVPLTSVDKTGTHDKITTDIVPRYSSKIPHIHVW